jgi:hypothetical protein
MAPDPGLRAGVDRRPGEQFVYLKYWKPVGVVCTTDRSIRDNIIDAVCKPYSHQNSTLDPKPETQNTKHETRNTKHETRNTKPQNPKPKTETRNPKHETRNTNP